MAESAVACKGLTKRFGKQFAIRDLSMEVPKGGVFGFVGRNGAGKTTTIRIILGLLSPTSGSSNVLGLDSRRRARHILSRVGYVPEVHDFYPWMTVEEKLWFTSSFYGTWDKDECAKLVRRFQLPPKKRVSELSKGMRAKLALTLALAHKPELLVLDEPTSGLDAVVRKEFLDSIVRVLQEEGKTVFFSSHMLSDVERVADTIGILHLGHLHLVSSLDALKERVRRVRVVFDSEPKEPIPIDGILDVRKDKREWVLTLDNFSDEKISALKEHFQAKHIDTISLSLEEIFIALLGEKAAQQE